MVAACLSKNTEQWSNLVAWLFRMSKSKVVYKLQVHIYALKCPGRRSVLKFNSLYADVSPPGYANLFLWFYIGKPFIRAARTLSAISQEEKGRLDFPKMFS